MIENVFVDTNILVYSYSLDDPVKVERSRKLLRIDLDECDIFISTQIINEFYATMSRRRVPHDSIKQIINELYKCTQIRTLTFQIIEFALELKEKYLYSWWDSLVLSSALESNCSVLYSEDMQHKQIIENSLEIINPFI